MGDVFTEPERGLAGPPSFGPTVSGLKLRYRPVTDGAATEWSQGPDSWQMRM